MCAYYAVGFLFYKWGRYTVYIEQIEIDCLVIEACA